MATCSIILKPQHVACNLLLYNLEASIARKVIVWCMAHILNLGVQDVLKDINAAPPDNIQVYHLDEDKTRVVDKDENGITVSWLYRPPLPTLSVQSVY